MSGLRRCTVAAAILLTIAEPSNGQTQQQLDACNNKGGAFSNDQIIAGCTAVIQSGDQSKQNLVDAYLSRSRAYNNGGEFTRAIADYDEARRLNGDGAPAAQRPEPKQNETTPPAPIRRPTVSAGTFRDCSDCPTMMKVPAGTFTMGSTASERNREQATSYDDPDAKDAAKREQPRHSVTIKSAFALGQFAVTRGEFATFVRETGYDPPVSCYAVNHDNSGWRNPGYAQTDQHPVVCVSFEDAQHYVQWLSTKAGKSYRLPTEAEWEYAARAGTTTARFWGDGRDHACDFANAADFTLAEFEGADKSNREDYFQCRDGYARTAPVGSFRPNAFGLYDMLGNVWQLTEDCLHESYDGAPSDGSAWMSGDCTRRMVRGGEWVSPPFAVRSAHRSAVGPDVREDSVGFRVVRALTP